MSFAPIAYINEPRWQESRLGLDRIRELLDRLGRPQDRLRFVHVAGTNGKGSTCAYLAAILQTAGLRTGLFTSPYLVAFEERIRVDGVNISLEELTEATLLVKEQAEAMAAETGDHPTEFELMTAVALVQFARRECDIVVLEVGLGGRLDSTNVIDAPEATVVARIGLDHTKLLGSTLAAIAREKAGIVKPGAPVVSWPQEPEAMAEVKRRAAECGCTVATPDFAALEVGGVSRGKVGARGKLGVSGASDAAAALVRRRSPTAASATRRGFWEATSRPTRCSPSRRCAFCGIAAGASARRRCGRASPPRRGRGASRCAPTPLPTRRGAAS